MKKILRVISVILILISYPVLIFVWHPRQMIQDLSLVEIPTASSTLSYRKCIDEKDVKMRQFPSSVVTEDTIFTIDELLGKRVRSDLMIAEGSIFTQSMIEESTEINDQASVKLNQGQAAFSLNADLVQVAGNTLQINQKIDLYCTLPQRNQNPIIDKLLESVRIIDLRDRRGLSLDNPESTGIASVIILAVNQEVIPILSTATELGTLQVYVTSSSWQTESECILFEESQVLPYLGNNKDKAED